MSGTNQRSFGGPQQQQPQPRPGGNGRNIQSKLVLLGDQGVGKSSIAARFVNGQYTENKEATIGAAFFTLTLPVQGAQTVKFDIWDTAGQERYNSLAPMYYRGAQAAVVVYDLNNAHTFNRAMQWVRELRAQAAGNMLVVLAGNKADLAAEHRAVSSEDARAYAEDNGLIFAEVSAKTGLAIREMFTMIANKMVSRQFGDSEGSQGVRLTDKDEKKSGCKC